MVFQTKVELPPVNFSISYRDKLMTFGSCFAENIGEKLENLYFQTIINPFGILYNPISISNSIKLLLENKQFSSADLFQNKGLWQSFSHSSLFSATTAEKCIETINDRFNVAVKFIKQTDYILITFGTAWVFEDRKSGSVVSNCHKLPASHFLRRRLTVDEIVEVYSKLINQLTVNLPNFKLIFSVSPIRHWKDGAHENTISKSILLLAIDELQKQFSQVYYFPAYEIQLDELRDYRFYASDMLHPSDMAIDYIWNQFSETYFNSQTRQIKNELEKLNNDLAHRPIHVGSEEHLLFEEYLNNKKKEIHSNYPFIKFDFE